MEKDVRVMVVADFVGLVGLRLCGDVNVKWRYRGKFHLQGS